MKKYFYFIAGGVFGMCGEYLYRVKFSIYPLLIMVLILLFVFLVREKENLQ